MLHPRHLLFAACLLLPSIAAADAPPVFGSVFDVTHFGARGDGAADDSQSVQLAVDTAVALGGGTVLFPAGTYRVANIYVAAGITLQGYGATVQLSDQRLIDDPTADVKWLRIFRTDGETLYWGEQDSAPLVVRGLTFDGNRQAFEHLLFDGQGEPAPYALEQQHMLFLRAAADSPGRLVARVHDCTFHDGLADGISIYTNVSATIADVSARDVFRGGLSVTGGNSRVYVRGFEAGGQTFVSGIDIEPDGLGFGGTYRVDIDIQGMRLAGDLDIGLRDGSTFVADNLVVDAGPINIDGHDSTLQLDNCIIGGTTIIRRPFDMSLRGCRFTAAGSNDAFLTSARPRPPAAVRVIWYDQWGDVGQRLRIVEPRFRVGADVWALPADTPAPRALDVLATRLVSDNQITVSGGEIPSTFGTGVFLEQGGQMVLRDLHIDAPEAVRLGCGVDGYQNRVLIDGVSYGDAVTHAENYGGGCEGNIIDHRDVELEAAQAGLDVGWDASRLPLNTYRGRRIIRVDGDPSGLPCLVGDVARAAPPRPGMPYAWACITTDADAGDWLPLTAIGD